MAFCEEAKALHVQAGLPLALNQWYLEPAAPAEEFRHLLFRDEFDAPELRPEWQWEDPFQASSYRLSERSGHLTLRPGPDVALWPSFNLNAPRVLLEVTGDFALEAKLEEQRVEGSFETGGLLIWSDVLNYMCLDRSWDIRLEARVAGNHGCFGRGLLPGHSCYLRLERTGERFAALCSTEGVQWWNCGTVILPVQGPLRVGVWAGLGMLAHFDWVQVLGRE